MKATEAILRLRAHIKGHLEDEQPHEALARVLRETETIETDPSPELLHLRQGLYNLRGDAGLAPAPPYAPGSDLLACLNLIGEISRHLTRPRAAPPPDPCDNILNKLQELAATTRCPWPPFAPAASSAGKCLDVIAVMIRHEVLADEREKKAFATLENSRAAIEEVLTDTCEKLDQASHDLEHERAIVALAEMVEERDRAIVALVLNDLELRK